MTASRRSLILAVIHLLFLFWSLARCEAGLRESSVKIINPEYDQYGRHVSDRCGSGTISAVDEAGLMWGTCAAHNFIGRIGGRFQIEAHTGDTASATLRAWDPVADIAIFSVIANPKIEVLPISDCEPADKTCVIGGFPGGVWMESTATIGDQKMFADKSQKVPITRYNLTGSLAGVDGASGGAVVSTTGEQIGILTGAAQGSNVELSGPSYAAFVRVVSQSIQVCNGVSCRTVCLYKLRKKVKTKASLKPKKETQPLPAPVKSAPEPEPLPDANPPQPAAPGITADDLAPILKQLAALQSQIAAIKNVPGPPGPAVPSGDKGQSGSPGLPGPAGPAGVVTVRLIDNASGKVIKEVPNVKSGSTARIPLNVSGATLAPNTP